MRKLFSLEATVQENNELLRRLTLTATASQQHEDTSFHGLSLSPIETEEEWELMLQTLEDDYTKKRMV